MGKTAATLGLGLVATASAAAAAPCSFSLWSFDPSASSGGASCRTLDLSALPTKVFRMKDRYPDLYAIAAPCADVTLGGTTCNASAVQLRDGSSCGLPLGTLSQNTTAPLPSGGDGMRIALAGGAGGRTMYYDMICDKTVPASNPPDPLVETCTKGKCDPDLPSSNPLNYLVTWRTPHACTTDAPELLGSGRCAAPNVPLPTANQLRYQQSEIVALTHFK